MEKVYYQRI